MSESLEAAIGFHEGKRQQVVIFSSHASLLRDLGLASRLRSRGLFVASQTLEATGLGLDKTAFKKTLKSIGVATPQWGELNSLKDSQPDVLLKLRNVTQSQGILWYDGTKPAAHDDWYWEVFILGCEYSILAFVDSAGTTLFPAIWKGNTRTDLLPPWRRPRMCPDPRLDSALEARLMSATRTVLDSVKCWGFVELEFIVDPSGSALLLEINPRVCGTMRIAAMACNTNIFSLPATGTHRPELFAPTRQALEVPYDGIPFVSDDRRVVASSRITFAADSAAELIQLATTHLPSRLELLAQVADLLDV
ncbi:MAG: hypothetical protein ABL869_03930 [Candidatus Nitrotoga sp.]